MRNSYKEAKSHALKTLEDAAKLDAEIATLVKAATSPHDTVSLRKLCRRRLTLHGKVTAAVRYVDQSAKRTGADPVRAAILRGDLSVINPAIAAEIFEPCAEDDADVEHLLLLSEIWPIWCLRAHDVSVVAEPVGLTVPESPLRVRAEWRPRIAHLWPSIAADLREDLNRTRHLETKLRALADQQLGYGQAGEVVDERGSHLRLPSRRAA